MTDLFLIAHKVRGEPAFDVASQMPCPNCGVDGPEPTCSECNGEGFWWIVPTSGHRAYPFYSVPLNQCVDMYYMDGDMNRPMQMPPALPDHYTSRAATVVPSGLAALLAKRKPLNVERRGR